jgi:hypothetical protein
MSGERDTRLPADSVLDHRTLESILEIVQEIRTRLERVEVRLEEHDAQPHHLDTNYVRTTSPPDLVPNRPRLPKMLDVVSNPCLRKTPGETLASIRPRRKRIPTVDFPRTTGTVRVRYLVSNQHVNLRGETVNENTRIQVANSSTDPSM